MDLDGVMFTDAPVLLSTDPRVQQLRATLGARWGGATLALLRFHAMGFDAWALANGLASTATHASAADPRPVLDGLSGQLSLDGERRIHRETIWGEFRDGGIVLLPPP